MLRKIFKKIKAKLKKNIAPIRRSPRLDKQILHLKVRDFLMNNPLPIGLDIGCANMPYRPLFRTQRYIGVDLDGPRLLEGQKMYPDAEIFESSLFDMPESLQGDLVVCIQTIDVNAKFDKTRTMEAIEKLIAATKDGGSLIFNLGTRHNDWRLMRNKVNELLEKNFSSIEIDRIGFDDHALPMAITLPVAYVLKSLPFLHRINHPKCLLFIARGKK